MKVITCKEYKTIEYIYILVWILTIRIFSVKKIIIGKYINRKKNLCINYGGILPDLSLLSLPHKIFYIIFIWSHLGVFRKIYISGSRQVGGSWGSVTRWRGAVCSGRGTVTWGWRVNVFSLSCWKTKSSSLRLPAWRVVRSGLGSWS